MIGGLLKSENERRNLFWPNMNEIHRVKLHPSTRYISVVSTLSAEHIQSALDSHFGAGFSSRLLALITIMDWLSIQQNIAGHSCLPQHKTVLCLLRRCAEMRESKERDEMLMRPLFKLIIV